MTSMMMSIGRLVMLTLSGVDSGEGAAMMSNTPRVFVGATSLLLSDMTSTAAAQTVTTALNGFPGVHVTAADSCTGLVTLSAQRPVDRSDLIAAITQAGYTVLA